MLMSGELIASWHLDGLVEDANTTLQEVGKVSRPARLGRGGLRGYRGQSPASSPRPGTEGSHVCVCHAFIRFGALAGMRAFARVHFRVSCAGLPPLLALTMRFFMRQMPVASLAAQFNLPVPVTDAVINERLGTILTAKLKNGKVCVALATPEHGPSWISRHRGDITRTVAEGALSVVFAEALGDRPGVCLGCSADGPGSSGCRCVVHGGVRAGADGAHPGGVLGGHKAGSVHF
jgi:hypothetical protein